MKTIIEPFKIKMVESLRMTTREERERIITEAGHNLFLVKSQDVLIDLLTDSGTGSMSDRQWASMILGDEAYAGSRSFFRFADKVREITGFKHVIPTHQGRAAEHILFGVVTGKGDTVPNNTHFDTTRANIENTGAVALDFVCPEGKNPQLVAPFKGNMDVEKLDQFLSNRGSAKVPLGMLTITNNASGGQPVSMDNIRRTAAVYKKHQIPFFLDACRFAENAYFIKTREPGYADKSLLQIAQEAFSYADGCTMSAKKDALVNIGGFLAMNNDDWAHRSQAHLILTEGFVTYGGLAGRDLDAMAQGLTEVLEEDYMHYRIRSTQYLGEHLNAVGVPTYQPAGGHAIYVDARAFLPHIPASQYPGQALCVAMFVEGGIRAVEIGSVMFGKEDPVTGAFVPAANELVRLAIPRRVYTQSHIDYVIEVMEEVAANRDQVRGLRFKYRAPVLPHFTSTFEMV
jgi:tyrosine phenol-lyase